MLLEEKAMTVSDAKKRIEARGWTYEDGGILCKNCWSATASGGHGRFITTQADNCAGALTLLVLAVEAQPEEKKHDPT
jgi:hypothetical protein